MREVISCLVSAAHRDLLSLAGVPISCICNHIDTARRVAVGATRHAFLALHTLCGVAAAARFVVFVICVYFKSVGSMMHCVPCFFLLGDDAHADFIAWLSDRYRNKGPVLRGVIVGASVGRTRHSTPALAWPVGLTLLSVLLPLTVETAGRHIQPRIQPDVPSARIPTFFGTGSDKLHVSVRIDLLRYRVKYHASSCT